MVEFAHEKAKAALDALEACQSDSSIAYTIAAYLLVGKNAATLSINHNPKSAPCPLRVDRAGAKSCSVTLRTAQEANVWCIDALMRGYEVSGTTQRGVETRSIAGERRRIQGRAAMDAYRAKRASDQALGIDEDDEIPF